MPKRPCTVAVTPDNSTILCGDKFGDVYSLPILGKPYDEASDASKAETKKVHDGSKEKHVPFIPAASSRTVHTKKNQEALRNQQRQIRHKKEKKVLNFEHQLLLGHVSLLTDLACVSLEKHDSASRKRREYIITSDRDEHIRISRGIPQAHIVEGYCQGHTEFISKLCILHNHPHLLVSGGGDDYLLIWDWQHGTLHQRLDLKEAVDRLKTKDVSMGRDIAGSEQPIINNQEQSIAVSGIWSTPAGQIIVTCEG